MFGRQAASWSAQGYIGKLGVVTKQLSAVSNSKQEVEQDGRLHSGERPAAEHLPVHAGHHAVVGRSGGMSQRSSAGVSSAVDQMLSHEWLARELDVQQVISARSGKATLDSVVAVVDQVVEAEQVVECEGYRGGLLWRHRGVPERI